MEGFRETKGELQGDYGRHPITATAGDCSIYTYCAMHILATASYPRYWFLLGYAVKKGEAANTIHLYQGPCANNRKDMNFYWWNTKAPHIWLLDIVASNIDLRRFQLKTYMAVFKPHDHPQSHAHIYIYISHDDLCRSVQI